jgi:hypothetical protein
MSLEKCVPRHSLRFFLFSYSDYSHILFVWSIVISWWHLILNKKIEQPIIEQTIISRTNICDRKSISIHYLKWNPKLCNVWNHKKKRKERHKTIVLVTSRPSLPPSSEDIRPWKSTSIFTKRKRLTEHVHSACVCGSPECQCVQVLSWHTVVVDYVEVKVNNPFSSNGSLGSADEYQRRIKNTLYNKHVHVCS